MRAERAGRAVDLAQVLGALDARQLAAQAVGDHGELLAKRRRRGGLAVGAREHRLALRGARHLGELVRERGRGGQPHLTHCPLDHERVRQVVDVLGRAREVHELAQRLERRPGDARLDDVLDRLDVVDGLPLERGVLGDCRGVETRGNVTQEFELGGGQGAHPRHRIGRAQVDKPFDLDVQSHAVERLLGQVLDQAPDDAAVAAVERAKRDSGLEFGQRHRGAERMGSGGSGLGHDVIVSRATTSEAA